MPLSIAFEAQTLLSADLQNKVHKTDDQVKTKLAPAERERERERERKLAWKVFGSKERGMQLPKLRCRP